MENETLLRLPEVMRRTGWSKSTIYQLIAEGAFPCPVQLGAKAVAWRQSDVAAWIAGRVKRDALEQSRGA